MSSTRRSRFTVTASRPASNAVEKLVILAPSASAARAFYADRGYTVLGVQPGDYRKQAAKRAAPSGGFRLNPRNVEAAKAFFDLKLPVEIKFNGRVGDTAGIYRLSPKGSGVVVKGGRIYGLDSADRLVHSIMLKSYLTPEKAGEALWHELTHAMQAERELARVEALRPGLPLGEKFRKRSALHSAVNRGVAYENKPCEVEARKHETMNATTPLAR